MIAILDYFSEHVSLEILISLELVLLVLPQIVNYYFLSWGILKIDM